MRNAARANWAHDVVRMSAVAPIRKQQSKKLRLHQDDPLSDGDDEGPKRIRSYIKPSKNIETYKEARRTQSKFEKLMKNHGLNRTRPPNSSSMRPPPMRKERRDLNRSPKRIHRGPAPVARSFSAPSSSKDLRRVDQARSSDTRMTHERTPPTKVKSKDAQHYKNMEAKKCENKRPPPPPPSLPERRTQTPSTSSFIDFGVQCDLTELCPPAKRSREDELESFANATSYTANSADPPIVLPPANEGVSVFPLANEGFSVSSPANEVETVAASTDVKWNEHLNLAYLFKRGTKIFTIDTLPAKENWYKEIFFANTDDRNSERTSPIEKSGQSVSMVSTVAKIGSEREDRNTLTSAEIGVRDGGRLAGPLFSATFISVRMRVAVNLNMFHPELPLLQRYKAAAAAGFRQVEVALPYSEKAEDLKKTADSLGLSHTLINAPAGEWSKGFRGLASLPAHKKEFQDSISTAIHYAKTLSCDKVHVMAGIPAQNDGDVSKLYQENVAFAASRLGEANLMCLIEPINHYSIPGYFLSTYEQAKVVIDAVALPNLKMQYDVFHAQQICGQITATVKKYKDLIGYIQVAQVPSRDEPSTAGEIDYKYVFEMLKSTNPDWTIGLEHNFKESHGSPSDWVKSLGLSM